MAGEGSSDGSGASREMGRDYGTTKVPIHREVEKLEAKVRRLEALLGHTFTTIAKVKEAHLRFQSACAPYDPDKFLNADKEMGVELKKLSALNQQWKQSSGSGKSGEGHSCDGKSQESVNLELQQKCTEVEKLKEEVHKLKQKKEKLERRVKKLEKKSIRKNMETNQVQDRSTKSKKCIPTHQLFESTVAMAMDKVCRFTKILVAHMKKAKWDLSAASSSIEPNIAFAKTSDRIFAFQSYISLRMFSGFENEDFYMSGSLSSILNPAKHRNDSFRQFMDMQSIDPMELVSITPDCLFGKFCHKKFLQIVHPKMEESFFRNGQHRSLIKSGVHPRSKFYEAFLKLAKAVWLVHKLAFSFDPRVSIFQVPKGVDFCKIYMESAVRNVEMANETSNLLPKIGFTVMPGFKMGNETLKCKVYLKIGRAHV